MAGWQNTIFTHGSAFPLGQGVAWGKVCPQHTPFLTFSGQTTHDGLRFGL